MKKLLIIISLFLTIHPFAWAGLPDLSWYFWSEYERTVMTKFCSTLNTPKKEWKGLTGFPTERLGTREFQFIPMNESEYDWTEKYTYMELVIKKSHSFEDIWKGLQNAHALPEQGIKEVIFQSDKELIYQLYIPPTSQVPSPLHIYGCILKENASNYRLYEYYVRGKILNQKEKDFCSDKFVSLEKYFKRLNQD